MKRSTVVGKGGESTQDNIRTSYGTFLRWPMCGYSFSPCCRCLSRLQNLWLVPSSLQAASWTVHVNKILTIQSVKKLNLSHHSGTSEGMLLRSATDSSKPYAHDYAGWAAKLSHSACVDKAQMVQAWKNLILHPRFSMINTSGVYNCRTEQAAGYQAASLRQLAALVNFFAQCTPRAQTERT